MRLVITPEEAARLDASGDVDALMERAGRGVAMEAVRMGAAYGTRITVLAGPGNNGGDGYVAARHLAGRGIGVEVLAWSDPRKEPAQKAAQALKDLVPIRPFRSPTPRDGFVIDALFGGGLAAGLDPAIHEWIKHSARVLSVDVPSGLDPLTGTVADAAFDAEVTVTFHALRTGHLVGEGPDLCGRIEVVDIGLSGGEAAWQLVEAADTSRPRRPRTGHKWSVGSTLVIGGSEGMVGAAILSARSALGFGAGASGVASSRADLVQAAAPELLAFPIDRLPDRFEVLVVGPGLGDSAGQVMKGLATDSRPMVIDADAIPHLAALPAHREAPTVITPHSGEFAELAGGPASPEAAVRLARATGMVVVLKGNPTFITDGGTPQVVTTNGPELATIGTGDVLAGMIGALLGRGVPALAAAITGAYWHGVAGAELAAEGTVTADRLADRVGRYAFEVPR